LHGTGFISLLDRQLIGAVCTKKPLSVRPLFDGRPVKLAFCYHQKLRHGYECLLFLRYSDQQLKAAIESGIVAPVVVC